MRPAWLTVLYNALATVRVRTEPAFALTVDIMIGWQNGVAMMSDRSAHLAHLFVLSGMTTSAMKRIRQYQELHDPITKRSRHRRDAYDSVRLLTMYKTWYGICSMLVWNVEYPLVVSAVYGATHSDRSVREKYAPTVAGAIQNSRAMAYIGHWS